MVFDGSEQLPIVFAFGLSYIQNEMYFSSGSILHDATVGVV